VIAGSKARGTVNYRLGCIYALSTAFLLATQGPLSALAAKHLSPWTFICVTQIALLLSVPLLTAHDRSRSDFFVLLLDRRNLWKLTAIALIGLAGLGLYFVGLKGAHPIIIAAIMNLSPFWAALVAKFVTRTSLPASPVVCGVTFLGAFGGAMLIAWSQTDWKTSPLSGLLGSGSWVYAVPIPIFYALSGALVGKWLSNFDDAAAVAANFLFSAVFIIPITFFLAFRSGAGATDASVVPVLLLLVGTLAAAAIGRVSYQIALRLTNNDNGFVTMFFLLVPGLSALISWPMSFFSQELSFRVDPLFFGGLILVTASLAAFSVRSLARVVADDAGSMS
jgi:drug/metabolite transporter (DMT)-like permease